MTRLPDWPERLAAYLDAIRTTPFAWARHDCTQVAAEVVHQLTGQRVGRAWLDAYADARTARRLLRDPGLVPMVSECLGDPVPAAHARRGDLVLYANAETGLALGVCVGAQFAAPGDAGLEHAPMAAALGAWRVG